MAGRTNSGATYFGILVGSSVPPGTGAACAACRPINAAGTSAAAPATVPALRTRLRLTIRTSCLAGHNEAGQALTPRPAAIPNECTAGSTSRVILGSRDRTRALPQGALVPPGGLPSLPGGQHAAKRMHRATNAA